jgi:hypothetical protein
MPSRRCQDCELLLQILVLGHVPGNSDDAVDLAGFWTARGAKGGLKPYLVPQPVTGPVEDLGFVDLALLQAVDGLLNARQVIAVNAGQGECYLSTGRRSNPGCQHATLKR